MRVAPYTRVSTADQKPDDELRAYTERQQWKVSGTYADVISGGKAQPSGLDRLMEDARLRHFDCVCVWKLDRFGRSLVDCLNNLQALGRCGVRFIAVTQGLDTDHNNAVSRFMLQVLGAAAEFERTLIVERSRTGQARYRRDYEAGRVGKTVHSRLGKDLPPNGPRRIFDPERVTQLRQQGRSFRAIAKEMGIGLGTVTRTVREPA